MVIFWVNGRARAGMEVLSMLPTLLPDLSGLGNMLVMAKPEGRSLSAFRIAFILKQVNYLQFPLKVHVSWLL